MSELPSARRLSSPRLAAAAMAACLAVAGCSHSGGRRATDTGDFNGQPRAAVQCLEHQTSPPGRDYTGGQHADTSRILFMLHYYVANGAKPYCDGKRPSSVDRDWARLYVRLGGQSDRVERILATR